MTYFKMKNLNKDNTRIIIGNPGCGKTTTLINMLKSLVEKGIKLHTVAYCSFSTAAIDEAIERATSTLKVDSKTDLPFFRTLHSMAFSLLGLNAEQLMTEYQYKDLGHMLQMPLTGANAQQSITHLTDGDKILNIANSARLRDMTIRDYMVQYNNHEFTIANVEDIAQRYEDYKLINNLYDYTDMLTMAKTKELDIPDLEYLFIDEAQDLSRLQWMLVDKMAEKSKHIIIAGDDKQCISTFAAADIDTFLNLPGKVEALQQSYRVPKKVYNRANKLMSKMKKYRPEGSNWKPREEDGIERKISTLPFKKLAEGEWMILTRTRYQTEDVAKVLLNYIDEEGVLLFNVRGMPPIDTDIYKIIDLYDLAKMSREKLSSFVDIKDDDPIDTRKKKLDYIKLFKKFISCETDKKLQPWEITPEFIQKLDSGNWRNAMDKIPFYLRRYASRTYQIFKEKGPEIFTDANIKIMTMHAAKGREADNVIVLLDVPKTVKDTIEINESDVEIKILYVAVTRAKKSLYLWTDKAYKAKYNVYL